MNKSYKILSREFKEPVMRVDYSTLTIAESDQKTLDEAKNTKFR